MPLLSSAEQTVLPTLTAMSESNGPCLAMVKALHRHDDGYISFALSEEEEWRPAFAIKASALNSMFPQFTERLMRNSFLSINASYRLARKSKTSVRGEKPLYDDCGYPQHTNGNLKYLCAAYCDIDCGRPGRLPFEEVYPVVYTMMASGALPRASMIVDSGRGMWLLWLLHDPEDESRAHHGAWAGRELDPLEIYTRINRALGEKLQPLGADPQATDGARYIRVPGSFRTDTETAVWWGVYGKGTRVFSYTLTELAELLGVTARRLLPEESAVIAPRQKVSGRRSGQIAANKNRLAAVTTLFSLRGGGLTKGKRGTGAWLYAMCLRCCGVDPQRALDQVRGYGQSCDPPYLPSECDSHTRYVYRSRRPPRWSYMKIAQELGVSRSEAEAVSQRIGKPFPDSGSELVVAERGSGRLTRPEAAIQRRAAILQTVSLGGEVPPYRSMQTQLARQGIEAGYITVRSDYKALNLETGRAGKIAQRSSDRQNQNAIMFPSAA